MTPVKYREGARAPFSYSFWKSVVDRTAALVALVALSPLLVLIAVIIRLDSPGSPIFRQERVGKSGRTFTAYKFRTMRDNNDDSDYKAYLRRYHLENDPFSIDQHGNPVYKIIDDPRVTRFGGVLRQTNLDELPQILNVLAGEMSFVGPRPDIPFAVEMYSDWHRERLCTTPGITGLWQVSRRNGCSFDHMVQLDIDYIGNQSLLLDSKIVLRTIGVVLRGDGSYRSRKGRQDG